MDWVKAWFEGNIVELIGYLGTGFTIATYAMKTMIPLRIAGVLSSVAFISYGFITHSYPVVATEVILLPLNALRLNEMLQLTRNVESAVAGDKSLDWLKPYTHKRRVEAGEILFRKGEVADRLFFALSGRFRLLESGMEIGTGSVLGEFGLITRDNRRTQTVECLEGGDMLVITYRETKALYFQNPKFGFYFLELIAERLLGNLEQAEARAARAEAALAEATVPRQSAAS
jgi:hypothetical protein